MGELPPKIGQDCMILKCIWFSLNISDHFILQFNLGRPNLYFNWFTSIGFKSSFVQLLEDHCQQLGILLVDHFEPFFFTSFTQGFLGTIWVVRVGRIDLLSKHIKWWGWNHGKHNFSAITVLGMMHLTALSSRKWTRCFEHQPSVQIADTLKQIHKIYMKFLYLFTLWTLYRYWGSWNLILPYQKNMCF